MSFLDRSYFGNTVTQYLLAGAVVLGIMVTVRLMRGVLASRMKQFAAHTSTQIDDIMVSVIGETRVLLAVFVSLYMGSLLLDLPRWLERSLPRAAAVALFVQIGLWGASFIKNSAITYRETKRASGDIDSLPVIGVVSVLGRVALWMVVFLLILDNFGVNVTALLAGLGIGGIAIALAVQSTLSDLLASISIMLDKPFEVGDFIIVDGMLGTVENIGVKSTRVQSLWGELLVFPNSDLLKARIRNYRQMRERRVAFTVGVIYQTPADDVAAIPGLIREAIEDQEPVRFDRAHFKEYGDSALVFEAVYFVQGPEYNLYMDVHQAVNLGIMRRFQARGIDFAYPTRTLYLQSAVPEGISPPEPRS